MSILPEAGIGTEEPLPPAGMLAAFWTRARNAAGEKVSYALADQVTYSFGNLVQMALISRHCTHWQFGIYILTQRTMDLLIQVCNAFFWSPYTFNLPHQKQRENAYTGSLVLEQMVCCVLAGLLLFGMSRWAATPARGEYYGVFAPLVLTGVVILFREFTRRIYFAQMRFRAAFWTEVATVGLQLAGMEVLIHMHRLNVETTLWVFALGGGVVSVYWWISEWRSLCFRVRESWADTLLNMRLGRGLAGGNLVFLVSAQCNPWLLGATSGPAAVGIYALCESVVNIPRVALNSLQNVMAPVIARAYANDGKPGLRWIVARYDRMLFLGSASFALLILVGGKYVTGLILLLFKRPVDYVTLALLAVNFVAFAATLTQSYGLTAVNRAGLTFYANLAGLAAQVIAAVLLVHTMGVRGAALALLVASVVVIAVRQVFYTREMRRA